MFRFSELEAHVGRGPGVYEVHTRSGVPLKVGIARNLLRRLRQHRASRQSGLRCALPVDAASDPSQIISKSSVLAKHLFFDTSISRRHALRTAEGRRAFLEEQCVVAVWRCTEIEEAQVLEGLLENSVAFRYRGAVRWR